MRCNILQLELLRNRRIAPGFLINAVLFADLLMTAKSAIRKLTSFKRLFLFAGRILAVRKLSEHSPNGSGKDQRVM